MYLVTAYGDKVSVKVCCLDGYFQEALNGIAVSDAVGIGAFYLCKYLLYGHYSSRFVVYQHAGGKHSVIINGSDELVSVDLACFLGLYPYDLKAVLFQILHAFLNGWVLNGGNDYLFFAFAVMLGSAYDKRVVGFGSARCECDALRQADKSSGNGLAGFRNGKLGVQTHSVERGGIAVIVGHSGESGSNGFLAGLCGSGIIEICRHI